MAKICMPQAAVDCTTVKCTFDSDCNFPCNNCHVGYCRILVSTGD
jgi:hypothetical protein